MQKGPNQDFNLEPSRCEDAVHAAPINKPDVFPLSAFLMHLTAILCSWYRPGTQRIPMDG